MVSFDSQGKRKFGVAKVTGSSVSTRDFTSSRLSSPICHQTIMADYPEAPLVTRPKTLDPKEYFNISTEHRRNEEARAALRANLKREYQIQLNNPHRKELIEDPALTHWVKARASPYTYFRPTFKTSLLGAMFGVAPLFILYFIFKTDRDRKEAQIAAGTLERKFQMSS
uniref:NADH dehydrogenase [ubiquinone] 1 beta subcomplex subunit 4 n=1 Tax=Dicentrarchus labrax TaxID=13489 RepID=E6ZIJ4_DICLA|nr:NADH dehydrogenase 1 beta subcomplex subunit 4 [Dicentrarchus labrax]